MASVDIRGARKSFGTTEVLHTIEAEVRAGNCACEVRNPSGKCCLVEVQRAIRAVEQPIAEVAS